MLYALSRVMGVFYQYYIKDVCSALELRSMSLGIAFGGVQMGFQKPFQHKNGLLLINITPLLLCSNTMKIQIGLHKVRKNLQEFFSMFMSFKLDLCRFTQDFCIKTKNSFKCFSFRSTFAVPNFFIVNKLLITAFLQRTFPDQFLSNFVNSRTMKLQHIMLSATVFFTFFSSQAVAQGKLIRSSLSATVSEQYVLIKGQKRVRHSVGQMGVMGSIAQRNHHVSRGFLIPIAGSKGNEATRVEWALYPVPFKTHVNIDFDTPVSGNLEVRLFDVLGQQLLDRKIDAKQSNRIHLGNLAQAEYVIHVTVMGTTFSKVLVNDNNSIQNETVHQ